MDINEFYDVYRIFKPLATREEYERDWNEFQIAKAEHLKQRGIQ